VNQVAHGTAAANFGKPEQREREICISPGDIALQKVRAVGTTTGDEGKLRVEADTSYGGSDHITLIGHASAGMGYRNESDTLRQEMEIMVKENLLLIKERDVAKQARRDLLKELDIWAQELESVTALQVAEDKEAGERKRQLKEEIACRETHISLLRERNLKLSRCITALTDLNQNMKSVVDAQQHEIEIVLDISQQDNMEKEKHIKELETELETSRGNVKELTSELHALRERMVLMEAHNVQSLGEAEMRCEESKQNILKSNMENEQRIKEHIKELETELETSRGNAKELTSELDALLEDTLFISLFRPVRDALHERMVSMEAHDNTVFDNTFFKSLGGAEIRGEESNENNLKDITIITENEKRIKEICASTPARHSAPPVPITLELGTSRDAFSEELNNRSHAKHRIERMLNSIDSLERERERAIASERDACRGLHRDRDMFDKDLFLF
jgi:hypothetical protein